MSVSRASRDGTDKPASFGGTATGWIVGWIVGCSTAGCASIGIGIGGKGLMRLEAFGVALWRTGYVRGVRGDEDR